MWRRLVVSIMQIKTPVCITVRALLPLFKVKILQITSIVSMFKTL